VRTKAIDFRSDNVGTVSAEMLEAISLANADSAAPYGGDPCSHEVAIRYSELFETEVDVFAVPTGTAANAMCLATVSPPWGAIFCHATAHVHTSECGATEHFSGGAKLVLVPGTNGKMDPAGLRLAFEESGVGQAHRSQAAALTVTQATEWGTVYQPAELDALCAVARASGLAVHMDGARLANAIVSVGCSPAEMTWRRGIDILSFGLTKNGGMLCDAVIVFRPELATYLRYRLRRSGYGWSKMRFASAQLLAYIRDDLWLRSARRANAFAARLASGLAARGAIRIVMPVETNELFLELPEGVLAQLEANGILVQARGASMARLVCRWDGTEAEVDEAISALHRLALS
jgi:threonine aldolase